ncbi:hypothetical protein cypCar_00031951, partial [Cyprinus carpio]
MQYTNITCYWETTGHHLNISSYRLQVNKTSCESKHSFISVGSCNTSGSDCSVQPIDSALHCFCADVLASTRTGSIRSPPYFFSGVSAVCLYSQYVFYFYCSETSSSTDNISQAIRRKTRSQTIQAFSKETLELCDLHPGSKYTVRLRAQDRRAHAHWSSWTSLDTTTAEKAPSAAPQLWRLIQPAEEAGRRSLTLLWK